VSEPLRVEIAGVQLLCKYCGVDVFFQKSVTLNRLALGGLFDLEGVWGRQATIYVCSACGYLHWFFAVDYLRHERFEAEEEAGEWVECLSCGKPIPGGAPSCTSCGWSWEAHEAEPA
jgi:hypothetical protein